MNQKGFANIILVVVIVILVGAVGYFAFVKKSGPITQQPTPTPTQTKTPAPTPTPTPISENKNTFVNNPYGLEFTLPSGYFIGSNHYGVTDATKAEAFFFRKESSNYNGVPVLDVSTNLKLSSSQTLQQLAQSVYDMNKGKNYVTTDLKSSNYGGVVAYEFGLQSGYTNPNGSQLLDSSGGKVVFLYQNGKVFQFLQTGADSGLTGILNSLKFK